MVKIKDNQVNNVNEVILSRRTIRRFQQRSIEMSLLEKFVNGARLAPSAANLQPLEYFIVTEKKICAKIFDTLRWAAYIKPKWAPCKDERPAAYIIVLVKDTTNKYYQRDVGFATENIVIAAEADNIGSCVLCNIDRDQIRKILSIPQTIHIDSVVALGYKAEDPIIEDLTDTVEYWRDENQVLHVPKRRLEDILHINVF